MYSGGDRDKERRMGVALTEEEKATYEWQIWVKDFGMKGQERLKKSTALVSRVGGLGSPVAYALAAAGIGKLVLAHGGEVKHSDLNRQILMTYDWLGKPRVESAARRLKELNPRLEVEAVPENINEENASRLVGMADIVFDCAPLFEERFAMNHASVEQGKPLIDAAMYGMEGQLTTILPGRTPCLACIYAGYPEAWKREFPVFGAVSGAVANLAVCEGIKVLAGFGTLLAGVMLYYDARHMEFRRLKLKKNENCPICRQRQNGSAL
jgi:molybdopterin/thiamine biosynthesis adenylyltransferase